MATSGSLAQRLMSALEAAQGAGGDWRGCGGAAIVVVPASGEQWDRVVDIRVEDGDDSLTELRRLLNVAETYQLVDQTHPAAPGRGGRRPPGGVRTVPSGDPCCCRRGHPGGP